MCLILLPSASFAAATIYHIVHPYLGLCFAPTYYKVYMGLDAVEVFVRNPVSIAFNTIHHSPLYFLNLLSVALYIRYITLP